MGTSCHIWFSCAVCINIFFHFNANSIFSIRHQTFFMGQRSKPSKFWWSSRDSNLWSPVLKAGVLITRVLCYILIGMINTARVSTHAQCPRAVCYECFKHCTGLSWNNLWFDITVLFAEDPCILSNATHSPPFILIALMMSDWKFCLRSNWHCH